MKDAARNCTVEESSTSRKQPRSVFDENDLDHAPETALTHDHPGEQETRYIHQRHACAVVAALRATLSTRLLDILATPEPDPLGRRVPDFSLDTLGARTGNCWRNTPRTVMPGLTNYRRRLTALRTGRRKAAAATRELTGFQTEELGRQPAPGRTGRTGGKLAGAPEMPTTSAVARPPCAALDDDETGVLAQLKNSRKTNSSRPSLDATRP